MTFLRELDGHLVGPVVGRVVIGRVLDAADGQRVPGLDHARAACAASRMFASAMPSSLLRYLSAKPSFLAWMSRSSGSAWPLNLRICLLQFDQFLHLLDEPRLDVGLGVEFLDRGAFAQRLVHDPLPLAARLVEQRHQLGQRALVEILGEAEAVAAVFQRADGFLERLLVGLADAHHLAHGAHLRAELVHRAFELLEGPAGELDHHVIAGRRVFLQRAVAPVGDLVQREAAGELGGDQRDGEPGGLGGQRRGARGARVDLDDDHAAGLRVSARTGCWCRR